MDDATAKKIAAETHPDLLIEDSPGTMRHILVRKAEGSTPFNVMLPESTDAVPMDDATADHSMTATSVQWRNRREALLLGDAAGGGFQANAEYTLLEMAENHLPPTANSDAIVFGLASRQNADGSWPIGPEIRPPLNGTAITSTALALRGLREYAPEGRRADQSGTVPTTPRAALVVTLAEAVKGATLAGDVVAARVASEALMKLLGGGGDGGAVEAANIHADRERERRGNGRS